MQEAEGGEEGQGVEEGEREFLYERASQYGEESIKIVRLNKTSEPLVSLVWNWGRRLEGGGVF